MTVGEALAGARTKAGLSVDEVSERTKIREIVIRGIERDDFEACGGDLFVRGYVRVIADAVGIDAQPLIREYDKSHRRGTALTPFALARPAPKPPAAAPEPAAPQSAAPAPEPEPVGRVPTDSESAAPESASTAPVPKSASAGPAPEAPEPADPSPEAASPEPKPAPDAPAPDEPESAAPEPAPAGAPSAQSATAVAEPAPAVIDLTRAAAPDAADLSRAGSAQPGHELEPVRIKPGPRLHPSLTRRTWRSWLRDRRRSVMIAVSAVVVLSMAIVGGEQIASRAGAAGTNAAAGSGARQDSPQSAAAADANPAGVGGGASGVGTKSPAVKAAPRRGHAATARPGKVRKLPVPLAEAYGPDGPGDGDNPDTAMNAVRPAATRPWKTQWYATARFGALKPGTGLLLDMGRAVTVTGVTIDLGAATGANVQLRAGKTAGRLRTVSSAAGVGGNATLHPSKPARDRYLLIWFTQLPQVGNGQYQASVRHVTVHGHR